MATWRYEISPRALKNISLARTIFFNMRREILVSPSGHVIFFLYKILTIEQKTKKPQVLDSTQKYCELIGQCDITCVEKMISPLACMGGYSFYRFVTTWYTTKLYIIIKSILIN